MIRVDPAAGTAASSVGDVVVAHIVAAAHEFQLESPSQSESESLVPEAAIAENHPALSEASPSLVEIRGIEGEAIPEKLKDMYLRMWHFAEDIDAQCVRLAEAGELKVDS